jgi:hypothetical protein
MSKQLPINDLFVSRKIALDYSRAIYFFPSGFEIHATRKGVYLAGTSSNFNPDQMKRLSMILRWAGRTAKELAKGNGLIPQDELEGKVKLRIRLNRAWYEGKYQQGIERKTQAEAIASLRHLYLKFNENSL